MISAPILKDIVLLGGGHSHALLLRNWAMKPIAGIRLTLISRDAYTPYSGMLPGFVAGHYTSSNIHIDLSRLCRWAGVRFLEATATGFDPLCREILLEGRPSIAYDVLSIDTGSTPDTSSVPGADKYTVPVKPIHLFQEHWESFRGRADAHIGRMNICVVGSGVGGFELLLGMHHSMLSVNDCCSFHWIIRGQDPIRSHPSRARKLAEEACRKRGIKIHLGFDVVEVHQRSVEAADGRSIDMDEVFWCTAAAAPTWPKKSGLETDKKGFIATNAFLQSRSHPDVFAVGDVATQIETPNEKAGVFAVRQAPALFQNLRRYVLKRPLKSYVPQSRTLSLIALGEKSAIACRGRLTLSGGWVWRWKDHIDRSFMRDFSHLKALTMKSAGADSVHESLQADSPLDLKSNMRCGGCGAKVPAGVLSRTMAKLSPLSHQDILIGLDAPDDAAVIDTTNHLLAQSVDQFRAMIDDPYLFGRIAALHAVSDLHSIGAKPHSALALAVLPFAEESILERELFQIMSGAIFELNREGCALIGGHTSEGIEMSLGFAVNGKLDQQQLLKKGGLKNGDVLILTKALGTGVILAADVQACASGDHVAQCVYTMLKSNGNAAGIIRQYGAQAMTDVTGFGLLGHLSEMLSSAELGCTLIASAIPVLPGALDLSEQGITSSLYLSNSRFNQLISRSSGASDSLLRLLNDPQTSGGLLSGVPADRAADCIEKLRLHGYESASIIGECCNGPIEVNVH